MAGLREQKRALTRRHIADVAARMFGQHGYENVTVTDIARTAEVSPQTVYNYFSTKRDLLLDREDEITDSLVRSIVERPQATSVVAAVRPVLLAELDLLRTRTSEEAAGDLPVLCATSPEVRRLTLESRERQADAMAAVIATTSDIVDVIAAKAVAWAVLAVLQAIVDIAGRHIVNGVAPLAVAEDLEPDIAAALDVLEKKRL